MTEQAFTPFAYLHQKPTATAIFKANVDDFKVKEIPLVEPDGTGEHVFLWLRKTQLNTAFVAEQLAKFAQVPLRDVSYAGRKDKFAVTEQFFSVRLPGGTAEPDWTSFQLAGCEILGQQRHSKKLRTGALRGNHFELILRDVSHPNDIEPRLEKIIERGVPNYYGEQRFGHNNSNLLLGLKMAEGEAIRNRNRRSMAISALRSFLFNQIVSERIQHVGIAKPLPGDVMQLAGSNSIFCCDIPDDTILARLQQRDIAITAPLWGEGKLLSQTQTAQLEQKVADQHPSICQQLQQLGLKQERRKIVLNPSDLSWHWEQNHLHLQFSLESGCFATSVIRELVNYRTGSEE